jgi:hypothetical protein
MAKSANWWDGSDWKEASRHYAWDGSSWQSVLQLYVWDGSNWRHFFQAPPLITLVSASGDYQNDDYWILNWTLSGSGLGTGYKLSLVEQVSQLEYTSWTNPYDVDAEDIFYGGLLTWELILYDSTNTEVNRISNITPA